MIYFIFLFSVTETNHLLLHSSLLHHGLKGRVLSGGRGLGRLGLGLLRLFLVLLCGSLSGLRLGGSSLGVEILKGQTDDGLLDLGGSSTSLSGVCLSLTLLVHLSPGLGPLELNRSDSLLEQRANLVTDEEMDLSVFSDVTRSSSGVHTVLGELTDFSLDNHDTNTNKGGDIEAI